MTKSFALGAILLLTSMNLFAEQLMYSKTIKNVIINFGTGIHFRIDGEMPNLDGCASAGWYKIESDSKYEKESLSLLLAYEAQKKPINFNINGCTGRYPKVEYIHS